MNSRDHDFEAALEESHVCDVCTMIIKQAVEIECPHTFCLVCLMKWQDEPQAKNEGYFLCPTCKTPYEQYQVHRSKYLDRIIQSKTPVKCKKSKNGCQWVGMIDQYYEVHEKECFCRLVTCDVCNEEIMFNTFQKHQRECYMKCPNSECEQLMKVQEEVSLHLQTECLHERIRCAHALYGCNVMMKRGMIHEHHRNLWSEHLELFEEYHNTAHRHLTEEKDDLIAQLVNTTDRLMTVTHEKDELRRQLVETADSLCCASQHEQWKEEEEHNKFKELEDLLDNRNFDVFKTVINSQRELAQLKNRENNKTLIHVAAEVGSVECVKILLENGCDATEKDSNGWMAIHFAAAWNGHPYTVELLLSHDPSLINATTYKYSTPLHWAAYCNHIQTVKLLLKQPNVDVTAKDWLGRAADECTASSLIRRKIRNHGRPGCGCCKIL